MKRVVILLVVVSLGMVLFLGYSLISERTERITKCSPDNRYAVTALWADFGGFGYKGKIYFVDEKGKKLYTEYDVPASYEWVSNDEFYIDKGFGEIYYFKAEEFE